MPPALLNYAVPFFVALLLLELWFTIREHKQSYATKDTFSSLSMGIGNLIIGILTTKALVLASFIFVYQFRIVTLGYAWWVWILAFFADDLSYYWFHRASHHIRWFWASHVVHHSSQHYNLSTALRQNWTGNFTGTFVFWIWMPVVGFDPVMIMIMQQVSLIYQFWIHTEAINKLPKPLEFILNTPSHHRVHHGSDLKYLDKNHGGILIIWDRIFGTFKAEEERPKYGLTKNISSHNPLIIAFKEWGDMFGRAYKSRSVKYFFRPPGWSHDGSSKTTREMVEEYNRLHPDSPIH